MLGRHPLALALLLVLGTALICPAQTPKKLTDEEVLKVIYGVPRYSGPRVPAGFYREPRTKDGNVPISVSWVRRQADRNSPYFPVHAKDADEARNLAQEFLDTANLPAGAKKIVRQQTTPRFFQFDTEYNIENFPYLLRLRVWRTDFYQAKPVTFNASASFARVGKPQEAVIGVLRTKPLDKDNVRQIAEFFWWEENRDLTGAYVLRAPTVKEQGDLLIVSFPAAERVFGDFGVRDLIKVFNSDFIVNKKTGDVTRKIEKVKEIVAR